MVGNKRDLTIGNRLETSEKQYAAIASPKFATATVVDSGVPTRGRCRGRLSLFVEVKEYSFAIKFT